MRKNNLVIVDEGMNIDDMNFGYSRIVCKYEENDIELMLSNTGKSIYFTRINGEEVNTSTSASVDILMKKLKKVLK